MPTRKSSPRLGSSPLTRGAPGARSRVRMITGLIPAHAGSTCCAISMARRGSAHPRSRGEHEFFEREIGPAGGSSPLTRGAPHAATQLPRRRRLIPAHAGSTSRRYTTTPPPKAHPRSRGEHVLVEEYSFGRLGSSPLTRGALRSTSS